MTQPQQYDEWNQSAGEWMRQTANDKATQAYNQSMAANEGDRIALDRAKFAWQQTMDKAGLTGKFEDSWTMKSNQYFTDTFGTWMPQGPQAGQQTLAANQQAYNQAYQNAQAYGQYYAPGTAPTQGQQTLAAQNQAQQFGLAQGGLMGYYTDPSGQQQQTLAGQQQGWSQGFQQQQEQNRVAQNQQTNAQAYLQLLSSLRGPADWAKYQQVLGATPGGMSGLVGAAMGQYVPGGGATTGVQPQAANLQSMYADVQGYGQQGYGQPQQYTQNPQPYGQNPQQAQQQYAVQQGSPAWGSGIGIGGQEATPAQRQQAQGGGTNTMGNLPAPNQIASQSWANMAPSQQQMLLGQYEAQGWNKDDVQGLMNQALPKYGSNAPTAGTFRLR